MRTSRLSQETSKLFGGMPRPEATALRRSTRSSLGRFAYREASSSPIQGDDESSSDLTFGSDIEDAVKSSASPPPPSSRRAASSSATTTTSTTRKRKRTTTTITAPGSSSSTKIKAELDETISATTKTKPPPSARGAAGRVRKPARTTIVDGAPAVSPPSDWEEVYAVAKAMRQPGGAAANAAVDTMGCERLADAAASPRDRRFHTLVALMLSSQTKDTVNHAAMQRLKNEMPACGEGKPPGLNLENMLAVDPGLLNQLIWQVGFHNNKTKYLKQAAILLRDKFDSDIPPTIEGLTSLPGVGPKMAYLCMAADNGWGKVEGIGVDVHVHRITNLWGWHSTKTPEETRLALQAWLPRDRWKEINWLLVGLGQAVCLPVGRKCGECELGLGGLCKAAEKKKVNEGLRRRREVKIEVVGKDEDAEAGGTVVKTEEQEVVVVEDAEVESDVVVNEQVPEEARESATDVDRGRRRRK